MGGAAVYACFYVRQVRISAELGDRSRYSVGNDVVIDLLAVSHGGELKYETKIRNRYYMLYITDLRQSGRFSSIRR